MINELIFYIFREICFSYYYTVICNDNHSKSSAHIDDSQEKLLSGAAIRNTYFMHGDR